MEGHSQSEFVWPASFNEQRGARPKNNEEAIRELLAPLDDPKRRRKATSPPTTDDTMQSTDVLTDCGIQFSDTLADSDHTKLRQDRVQSSRRYWERGTLHQGERFRPLEEGTPETFIDPSQDASLQELHESIASHSGDYALETEGESSSNAPLAPTLANEPIFGNPYDLQREIDTFDDTEEDEEGIENEGELLDGLFQGAEEERGKGKALDLEEEAGDTSDSSEWDAAVFGSMDTLAPETLAVPSSGRRKRRRPRKKRSKSNRENDQTPSEDVTTEATQSKPESKVKTHFKELRSRFLDSYDLRIASDMHGMFMKPHEDWNLTVDEAAQLNNFHGRLNELRPSKGNERRRQVIYNEFVSRSDNPEFKNLAFLRWWMEKSEIGAPGDLEWPA